MSRRHLFVWLGVAVLVALAALREASVTTRLRAEVARVQHEAHALAQLRAEREQLESAPLGAEALEQLRRDEAEALRLRGEIETLRAHLDSTDDPPVPPPQSTPKPVASPWIEAGSASPPATFQSVMALATAGETDALANLIAFEGEARSEMDAIFARLPEETRTRFGRPENVFATLFVSQVLHQNLRDAKVVSATHTSVREATVRLRLERKHGSAKESEFRFTRGANGWQLQVPADVVRSYEVLLTGSRNLAAR